MDLLALLREPVTPFQQVIVPPETAARLWGSRGSHMFNRELRGDPGGPQATASATLSPPPSKLSLVWWLSVKACASLPSVPAPSLLGSFLSPISSFPLIFPFAPTRAAPAEADLRGEAWLSRPAPHGCCCPPQVIELCRPLDSRLEHVDFESLFSSLSVRHLLCVFASLLLERRVIFIADKLRYQPWPL